MMNRFGNILIVLLITMLVVSSALAVDPTPAQLHDPNMWYKANNIIGAVPGFPVSSWTDSSGAGIDASSFSNGTENVYIPNVINGQPVVRHVSTSEQWWITPDIAPNGLMEGTNPYTILLVARPTAGSSWGAFGQHGTQANQYYWETNLGGYMRSQLDIAGNWAGPIFDVVDPTAAFHIYGWRSDGGATFESIFDQDPPMLNSTNNPPFPDDLGTVTSRINFGSDGANGIQGDIGEAIFYGKALTNTQLQNVTQYLATKWQVGVTPTEPGNVTLTVATNPAFVTDVTPPIGDLVIAGNSVVNISAGQLINCPDTWVFASWTGDLVVDPGSASTAVFMDVSKTVTANFVASQICGDICHSFPLHDFNQDCIVNLLDFEIFSNQWMVCTQPACD